MNPSRPVLLHRRARRGVAALLLSGLALVLLGAAPNAPVAAATTTDLRVGSFNLSNVSFDPLAGGDHRRWRERRAVVADQIISRRLDVVGLQEANPSLIYGDRLVTGDTQFADLVDALNERGGHYRVANSFSYNCVRSTSSKNCTYQNRGSALDNRIIYDTDTVRLVDQGSMKYRAQTAGRYDRYLEWATLQTVSTGRRFLFTNTHLDPYTASSRAAQWRQAVDKTVALRGSMPVISVGDYNSNKYSAWSEQLLPYTTRQGIVDVLNQTYRTNPVKVRRAETTIRAWMHSFNGWRRDASTWAFMSKRQRYGNNIDWIFATRDLRVKEWEVVADVNTTTMKVRGVIPSDHNLVRATVVLP